MTLFSRQRLLLGTAALVVAVLGVAQVPFSLDTTFRTEIQYRYVNSVIALPGGGVIASGVMRFPGEMNDRALTKLGSNGTRDISFPFAYGSGKLTPWGTKFYVDGGGEVHRMLYSGQPDPTFITMNADPYFTTIQGGDYHVFPDGRVLLTGLHHLSDTARGFVGNYDLVWFSNTGYLDTTRIHRKGNYAIDRIQLAPNGQFFSSGFISFFDGHAVDHIFRVNADGSVDTTFRTGVYLGGAKALLPLADGRVYAGGSPFFRAPNDTLWLVRFLPDGSLDPTFTPPHLFADDTMSWPGAQVVFLRPWQNGQIMVTGAFSAVNGEPRHSICILDSTGMLMPEFDGCGVGPFTSLDGTVAGITQFVVDADSTHYYVCGTYRGYTDGTVNDTAQRFISRLFVGDISTGTAEGEPSQAEPMRVYPAPTCGPFNVELASVPSDAVLVVRDALGRDIFRHRVTDRLTSLDLGRYGTGLFTLELLDTGKRIAVRRVVVEP